jgi:hypothetical protein
MNEQALLVISGNNMEEPMLLNLYNTLGQTVLTQLITSNQTIIKRENLPQGIYFYTIKKGNNVVVQNKLEIN